jgi:limonene-1,2-epoxide hydrolase
MSRENVEIVRRWVEEQARPEFEPLEYIDAGGDAVLFLCRALPEDTGDYVLRHWSVFKVRDGKVVDWRPYAGNEAAARKAAGLSEQAAHADS